MGLMGRPANEAEVEADAAAAANRSSTPRKALFIGRLALEAEVGAVEIDVIFPVSGSYSSLKTPLSPPRTRSRSS